MAQMVHNRLHFLQPEVCEELISIQADLKTALTHILQDQGVLISAVYSSTAPKWSETANKPMDFILSALFAQWGLPSLHVPIGFSADGLPLGVQIISAQNCEHLLFKAAQMLDKEFRGWIRAQPKSLPFPFNPTLD